MLNATPPRLAHTAVAVPAAGATDEAQDAAPAPAGSRAPGRRVLGLPYLARRVAQAVFVVWAAFTLTFFILFALPGDSVSQKFGAANHIPPEQVAALRDHYGLDQPVAVQYVTQLGNVLRGDLGTSLATGIPVTRTLAQAFPQTIQLAGAALAVSVVVGLGLALAATYARRNTVRQVLFAIPAIGLSVPGFWIGLMLLWFLSFTFPIFPATGNDGAASLVLPAIALAVPTSATIAQVLARSLDDEWSVPYVVTAEAKGLSRWAVQVRHVLRNALIPTATVVAVLIGGLLSGTVVAETIFSRNGIGRVTQVAVTAQDVPVVQGVVLLSAAIYATVNLAVDLLYPVLDPRIGTYLRRGRR